MQDKSNITTPGKPKIDTLDIGDREFLLKALKRGMTRREALTWMMAGGLTAATAGSLFTQAGSVMAATPKKGGSVRMASNLHGPDDQLDPPLFTSTIDYTRGRATYNSLVQHSNDLVPQPELAESFEPNADASEWTFKIRKGVTFHDGSPLTADDVVYSMNRHQGDDSTSVIKAVMASVKEWKKTGSHEVKAILNTSNADLPVVLGIFQNKVVKNGSTGEGNGTGPFTMESFQPGVKSVHKRNENYWREGANLDTIEITAITDPVARVNALLAGDVQLCAQIDPKAFRQVEGTDGVTLLSTPAALQMGICCLKSSEPGSSDDFVKGIQYLVENGIIRV